MDRMRSVVVVMVLALGCFSSAFAANRTFVSGSGSDANPCSRDFPCRSFSAAIAVTTAGGEVVALDSAGYGPTTITGPITIAAGPGVHAGVSVTSGSGITVNAAGSDTVTLRHLYINGVGGNFGINVNSVGTLNVENCVVADFSSQNIRFVGDGSNLFINDSIIRGSGLTGVGLFGTTNPAHAVIMNSRIDSCTAEAIMITNGKLVMRHSSLSNSQTGVSTSGQSRSLVNILDSTLSGNLVGLYVYGPAVVSVRDSDISQNTDGITAQSQIAGLTIEVHAQNCTISGNSSNGVKIGGITGTTSIVTLSNCLITNSQYGVYTYITGTNAVRLTGNSITRNDVGVAINPGVTGETSGDNMISGNISFNVTGSLTLVAKQ